jgi:diguanylate cyclase (GGDEF)-like protein
MSDGHLAKSESATTASSAALEPAVLEATVLREQVRIIYQAPAILSLNLVNAMLTALILRPIYPFWAIAAWLGLFSIVIPARLLDWRLYRRAAQSTEAAMAWGRRFTFGAAATGCLWGLLGSAILLTPDPAYHAFVAFVLGGMVAGAVLSHAAYLPALVGFVAPTILPAIVGFFASANPMSITMGLLLAAFAAALGIVGYRANRWIASNTRRGIIQTILTADLEREVAERKRAENELRRSNEILKVVATSTTEILRSLDFDRSIPKVLELIGQSMSVSRVELYESDDAANGALARAGRYAWRAPGVPPLPEAQNRTHPAEVAEAFPSLPLLAQGLTQFIVAQQADEPSRRFLALRGALSVLMVPVFVEGKLWGAVGIDNCAVERGWSAVEIDTFRTLAELIGAAIADARTLKEMADADRIIENSSTVLYRLEPKFPYSVIYVSRNIWRFGYTQNQLLSTPEGFLELFHSYDRREILDAIATIADDATSEIGGEYRIRKGANSYGWGEYRMWRVTIGDQRLKALEGILVDITDRKTAEAEMVRVTHTDLLTGLPNRTSFMERLFKAFAAAKRGSSPFAVLYLDLDRFRDINETLGHSRGDALLKAVAERLEGGLRDADLIARIGGDEFAMFLSAVADPPAIESLATRISGLMTAPYDIGGAEIHMTASIGISIYRSAMTKPEDMMREADLAVYEAKDSGRNQHRFHSAALDLAVRERVTVSEELRVALERGELEVYYQPQVELPSGAIIGVEALLRWNHPKRGRLLPGRFIPIAEKAGVIVPLGRWVLTEACRQLRSWRADGIDPPIMAVNLSGAQLIVPQEFERDLAKVLATAGIDPTAIELELTETVLMDTGRAQVSAIERLRALGVRIAIDDFGTGYSSLEYLLAYRVNRIKVAQQFVKGLPADPGSAAIVRATIGLAREFEIEVIAEGVETAGQLEFLVNSGCQRVQGYYFSRPAPAELVAKMLRRGVLTPPAEGGEYPQMTDTA